MAQAAPMVLSLAFGAMQTRAQNKAISQRIAAREQQSQREVEEITRQQRREDEVAREKKSDRAREFDIQLGTLIASGADGGATKAALARAGAAAGFIAGLDKARMESNRQEGQSQKRARQIAIIEETAAANSADRARQRENTLSFFGNAAGTLFQSAYSATSTSVPSAPAAPTKNYVGPQRGEGRYPASGERGY